MSTQPIKTIVFDERYPPTVVVLDVSPTHAELKDAPVTTNDFTDSFREVKMRRYRRIAVDVPVAGMDDVDPGCPDLCLGSKLENKAIVYRIFPSATLCRRADFTAVESAQTTVCLPSWKEYLDYMKERGIPPTQ
jgi:hypothetical protein